MKNVIVTGGCGFIGSHIVDNLISQIPDVKVLIIDNLSKGQFYWNNSEILLEKLDIRSKEELKKTFINFEPDTVFHMAAEHYIPTCENEPDLCFDVNVNGTLSVLAAVSACKKMENFFFASTGDVYPPSHTAHIETDNVAPIYTYGESKLICERLVCRYFKQENFSKSVLIGRLFNAVGPRETNPHFLPAVLKQILSGQHMVKVGNTWPERDFVDVGSMADVILNAMLKTLGIATLNIGSGHPQQIGGVLGLIKNNFDFDIQFESVESKKRPNDRPILCPNVLQLKSLIGRSCAPLSSDTIRNICDSDPSHRFNF